MNESYILTHTYLDALETSKKNRPVWRSIVAVFPDRETVYNKMRDSFKGMITDSMISAAFNYDSAYIETISGGKEIWTITKQEK
jgi:hypothetical protein